MRLLSLLCFGVAIFTIGYALIALFSKDYRAAAVAGLIAGGAFVLSYLSRKMRN